MPVRWQFAFLPILLLIASTSASAQQEAEPSRPYVLHAYANLVQVPSLALTSDYRPLPPIPRDRFSISLDGGPSFHPTRMHVEGDEPISIAIVIDATGDQDHLLAALPQSLADMARTSLQPHDRVSIFSADCAFIRSGLQLPPDPVLLKNAIENGLNAPELHGDKPHHNCGRSRRIWDAASHAISALSDFPGRRVLLLVSSGADHKSLYTARALTSLANRQSVAVFAIRDLQRFMGDYGSSYPRLADDHIYLGLAANSEENFVELCESTGGLIVTLYPKQLTRGLQQILTLLRSRYVLEFPRPDAHTPGEHRIDVTIPGTTSFIVTAGVSIPLPDTAIDADPTTVHSAPSPAVMGTHNPSSHKP
jgi:VWFA-related protein